MAPLHKYVIQIQIFEITKLSYSFRIFIIDIWFKTFFYFIISQMISISNILFPETGNKLSYKPEKATKNRNAPNIYFYYFRKTGML